MDGVGPGRLSARDLSTLNCIVIARTSPRALLHTESRIAQIRTNVGKESRIYLQETEELMLNNIRSKMPMASLILAVSLQLGCNAIDYELPVEAPAIGDAPDNA